MEDFSVTIAKTIGEYGRDAVFDRAEVINQRIINAKRDFVKLLIANGIDQPIQPGFVSGSWKDLSENWLRRKKASLGNQRFYKGMSKGRQSLTQALLKLHSETVYGHPEIYVNTYKITAIMRYPGFTRRGRVIETSYRNIKGQFQPATPREAYQAVVTTFDPFPEIRYVRSLTDRIFIDLLDIPPGQQVKLSDQRPLLGYFTQWFFENKLKSIMESM